MEFLGTLLLAVSIVGSGHMAAVLTHDSGLQLLINAIATAIGLATVIKLGMKVSGAHFNPAVTLIMLVLKKLSPKLGPTTYLLKYLGQLQV
jgi:glycerol uptake facilitator-like aquaporin